MDKKFTMHIDVDSFLPASEEEKAYMVQMRPSSTFFRDGVKRLLKNKVATVSLIVILIITLSSLIIPLFWPYQYDTMLGVQRLRPVDASYNNLAPFQYGETEQAELAASYGHMTFLMAAETAAKAQAKRLWLCHYSQRVENPPDYLPIAQAVFPPAQCGEDGLRLTLRFED